jgi:hypothetical protein
MISTKTEIKLNFQNEFDFFNSINWKATNRNLNAEISIIKLTINGEIEPKFDSNAVVIVKIINEK